VNGKTWPHLEVEARRYRFRILNGSNSRFLILGMTANLAEQEIALPFWQIGAESGFLENPEQLEHLLMAPAERADVVVDFSNFAPGTTLYLINQGPDEPFSGGEPGVDFDPADPDTTGQVMEFRIIAPTGTDTSVPADRLRLPPQQSLGPSKIVRKLSLNEVDSETVCLDTSGTMGIPCEIGLIPVGPRQALLGTLDANGDPIPRLWDEDPTENIRFGDTETWELYNFTMDAHPIHLHLVQFEVIERQPFGGMARGPERWETGLKDTVIAFPGEITRIKAKFDRTGQFVWHCHILEHEDNEMMRPFVVSTPPPGK
jgi:spore coat protein A